MYLTNDKNEVREADITATNVKPSTAITRTDTAPKVGGGIVDLVGPYEGQSDVTIEVEIRDTSATNPTISQPVFSGVGNPTMTGVAATGLDVQDIIVTLVDPGTQTRIAYAPFQGVTLVAVPTGDDGNVISIDVDHSGLGSADTLFALRDDLRADSNEYVGDHWDFGAVALDPDGKIPANPAPPRLRFGTDPQVYLAFKQYKEGRYVYGFSPAPVRNVPAGAKVHAVSGTRIVTVTDNNPTPAGPPEPYAGIVTLYDFLVQLNGNSILARVPDTSPVVNDRTPGAMGATELSVFTTSYVLGVTNDGGGANSSIEQAELIVTCDASAPTETLTVTCMTATATGHETWRVTGDVSGRLDDAITAILYGDGPYQFTIPLPEIPGGGEGDVVTGRIAVQFFPNVRDTGVQYPKFCLDRPRLGAAAQNKTVKFVWTRRPPEDCVCDQPMQGGPDPDCLGIPDVGGNDVSTNSTAIRVQRLNKAVATLVGSNTSPMYGVAPIDIPWIEESAGIFLDALQRIDGFTPVPTWGANAAKNIDDLIEPTTRNGYRYAVTAVTGDRMTGATEPGSWTLTPGATVTDNHVTWTNIGKSALGVYDDYFTAWNDEMATISGLGAPFASPVLEWSPEQSPDFYLVAGGPFGFTGRWIVPTTRNGYLYYFAGGALPSTTGVSEPTWPTPGTVSEGIPIPPNVTPNPIHWSSYGPYWEATHAYSLGHISNPGTDSLWKITTAGTSGASEPDFLSAGPITDGSAVWTRAVASDLPAAANETRELYFEKFRTQMLEVLSVAGILDGNFLIANSVTDGCWRDWHDNDFWFVDEDGFYLPIQVGHYYHSATTVYVDDVPNYQTTREFSFGPDFGCPEQIQDGEYILVQIDGVNGVSTGQGYQPGDNFAVLVNHAQDIPFGGGQTGDDTQVWSVAGNGANPPGGFTPYNLFLPTPNAYAFDDGFGHTLDFAIIPGGIADALGDAFQFSVEGGHFRLRAIAAGVPGAWSADIDIAPSTSIGDGLAITMLGGAAPSWFVGDDWTFDARAVNGPDHLRTPRDGFCEWEGSTVITVTLAAPTDVTGLLLADHNIPSDAVITFQGSPVTWRARNIFLPIVETDDTFVITVDKGGRMLWLFIGEPTDVQLRTGHGRDVGRLTKTRRLPGPGVRRGLGITAKHSFASFDAADAFNDSICSACELDDGRLAFVPSEMIAEVAMVAVNSATYDETEVKDFMPRDPDDLRIAFDIVMEALQ